MGQNEAGSSSGEVPPTVAYVKRLRLEVYENSIALSNGQMSTESFVRACYVNENIQTSDG